MNGKTVCILTAGKGSRMGPLSTVINKALLPLDNKAIITHIINQFPSDTSFVIALGYYGEQVRAYLEMAHPELDFQFVNVDRYEGVGSGPGYSLSCCRAYLQKPFYFVSCDTLFAFDEKSRDCGDRSWIGIASVPKEQEIFYCNVIVDDASRAQEIRDKQATTTTAFAFTGLMYIHDVALFWQGFNDAEQVQNELQISSGLRALCKEKKLYTWPVAWIDVGDYEKYKIQRDKKEMYCFEKAEEFLYFIGDRVIKFFSDKNIVFGRTEKAKIKPTIFPAVIASMGQFYAYQRAHGETFYTICSTPLFSKLLTWLEKKVWTRPCISQERMHHLCQTFYRDKTRARLATFQEKYRDINLPTYVNGVPVLSVDEILEKLPWDMLCDGVPSFIHGDLQFDNILYDHETKNFVLLDWRQDFAGEITFGDLYYDLAKLLGGIILNYDYIKQALFTVSVVEDNLYIDFAQRYSTQVFVETLRQYIESHGLSYLRVRMLTGLIYLNMAPLHAPPFDQLLHAFGRLWLTRILVNHDGTDVLQPGQHASHAHG